MNGKVASAIIIAIVVVAGLAYALHYIISSPQPTGTQKASTSSSTQQATVLFPVALTDPPSVPPGTTALWVNYSGVVLITDNGQFYKNITGSVNLLELVNASKIIAEFSLPSNTTVNQVRLILSYASITINGTSYQVFLPSGVLKIPVNSARTGVLVDLRPHVVTAHAGKSTEYILTPAATAVPFNASASVGEIVPLSHEVEEELNNATSALTVVSAYIKANGNQTILSVTVKNLGNEPATVYAIGVSGDWQIVAVSGNFTHHEGDPEIESEELEAPVFFFVYPNGTLVPIYSGPSAYQKAISFSNASEDFSPAINFSALNGTGLTIEPNQTVTLNFSGTIIISHLTLRFEDGQVAGGEVYLLPFPGEDYSVNLISAPPTNSTYEISEMQD
ncbi:MAG: DUF4382 domain-containing protein [Nitrososphaeria archaeon]